MARPCELQDCTIRLKGLLGRLDLESKAASRIHIDRAAGCHRDHRGLDCLAAAGGPGAREAARRSQCVNNLKQIGLGLHNYLSAQGVFPPGRINSHIAGQGNCWGLYAQMLPQLEQPAIFNGFNFQLAPEVEPSLSSALANQTGYQSFLNTLICPSDSAPVLITVGGSSYATHNYSMNAGSMYSVVQNPASPLTGAPNGPFFENSRVSTADVTDGTSTSVAISETVRSTQSSTFANDPFGVFLVTGNNSTTGPPISSDADYVSKCLSLPPTTSQFQNTRGVRWHYGAPGHTMYNHRRPPNDKRYDCRGGLPHSDKSDPNWNYLSLNVTARSRHPGGANSLFLDGHVQFIKDSVNVVTWQAIGSRNGQEVVSADGF